MSLKMLHSFILHINKEKIYSNAFANAEIMSYRDLLNYIPFYRQEYV